MPWVKGQSGNKSGRPKGAAGLAAYIGEQSNDGRELVDILMQAARGDKSVGISREAAIAMLLDRHLGRPVQKSQVDISLEVSMHVQSIMALPPARRLAFLDEQRAAKALPAVRELAADAIEFDSASDNPCEVETTPDSERDS